MIAKNLSKLISDKAILSILNKIGYMAESLYDFKVDDHNDFSLELAVNVEKKWLIIVERGHYFESVKDYPIGDLRDLKNVLKNLSGGFPYKGQVSHKIERISDSAHRVTTWVIKQQTIDQLENRPKWLVPVSACLVSMSRTGVVALTLNGNVLYITETADGLISSLGREEDFLRSAGVMQEFPRSMDQSSVQKKVISIFGGDAVATILVGLVDLFKAHPFMFFLRVEKAGIADYPWFGAVKRSIIFFVSYVLASSLYLAVSTNLIDFQLGSQTAETESALARHKKLSTYKAQALEIQNVFTEQPPSWVAWDILLDLLESGISFSAVNGKPPEVTFVAMAPRATDVLAALSSDTRVKSASFTFPVRKLRDQEQFTIKVRFHNPVVDRKGGEPITVDAVAQKSE